MAKSYEKKKEYQRHIRDQVLAGNSNLPGGTWVYGEGGPSSNAYRNSVEGCKGKGKSGRRPKKQKGGSGGRPADSNDD